jgi:hypothetical protein
MRKIGGNLITLRCKLGLEEFDEIVKYCPNLETLEIVGEEEKGDLVDDIKYLSAEGLIKRGLKKLSKFMIGRGERLVYRL